MSVSSRYLLRQYQSLCPETLVTWLISLLGVACILMIEGRLYVEPPAPAVSSNFFTINLIRHLKTRKSQLQHV
jgi:hypothetical protein